MLYIYVPDISLYAEYEARQHIISPLSQFGSSVLYAYQLYILKTLLHNVAYIVTQRFNIVIHGDFFPVVDQLINFPLPKLIC